MKIISEEHLSLIEQIEVKMNATRHEECKWLESIWQILLVYYERIFSSYSQLKMLAVQNEIISYICRVFSFKEQTLHDDIHE